MFKTKKIKKKEFKYHMNKNTMNSVNILLKDNIIPI